MASDLKRWDVFRDPRWLLDNLFGKYKVLRIPNNANWTGSHAGSGFGYQEPMRFYVYTGTTASSRGMFYAIAFGLNSGTIHYDYVDWTKRLELELTLGRSNSDPEVNARVQLKESNAEGILAVPGIGVSIANFAMTGEAYGTARGTVGIGTLTDSRIARVKIVKTMNEVQFWVNGVLAGTLTGAAVPSAAGTARGYLVFSITNGPTGGVNAVLIAGDIKIVQEW